jgi:hypothetical protein
MVKDRAILDLLSHFTGKYGSEAFVVRDHWDGDLCALGCEDTNGRYLLYLNCYQRPADHFYLALEDIRDPGHVVTIEHHESVPLEVVDRYFERYITSPA